MSGTDPTVQGPSWQPGPESPQSPQGPESAESGDIGDQEAPSPEASPSGRPVRTILGVVVTVDLLRLVVTVVICAVVVGVPVWVASRQASKYFVFSPGTAPLVTASAKCVSNDGNLALPDGSPCVRLVLPKGKAHNVHGKLFMVDVEVGTASPLQWAEWELGLLGKSRQLVPVADYAGSTPTSELGCQDDQEMVSANTDAALAALARLRYPVKEVPVGAQLFSVFAGSPAWNAGLQCNDLITAVNGKKITTAEDVAEDLSGLAPGTTVTLTDVPASGGRARVYKIKLVSPPKVLNGQPFTARAYLGVQFQTLIRPKLPFPVSIDAGDIGGPSAGLAFTLAILDALSNGDLTGGHRVAATGEIDPQGDVIDVGGVQQKAIAVQDAGAQIFFVPTADYADAMKTAGKGLTVIPVATLSQVLNILHSRYGGDLSGITAATAPNGA